MNAQGFYAVAPTRPRLVAQAKYKMTDAVVAVKGPGGAMHPEPRHLGQVGYIKGVHLFRGDIEHHYSVVFTDGSTDSIDESCLRR